MGIFFQGSLATAGRAAACGSRALLGGDGDGADKQRGERRKLHAEVRFPGIVDSLRTACLARGRCYGGVELEFRAAVRLLATKVFCATRLISAFVTASILAISRNISRQSPKRVW